MIEIKMTLGQVAKADSPEVARQLAIDWQNWQSERSMSYGELAQWQEVFRVLAEKFNLIEEFKENGII